MKIMWVALLALLGIGCGGASLANVRKDLPPGQLPRATVLFVPPAESSATAFNGDGSDDANAVATARQQLRDSLAIQVANALRAAGFQANLPQGSTAAPPTEPVSVWMIVRECNWGSNAKRALVGFGAGAAYLLTDVRLTRGNTVVADFTVDANSGGRGGLAATGDFTPQFMQQTAELIVQYLSERMK
jgi:hypothetical protein